MTPTIAYTIQSVMRAAEREAVIREQFAALVDTVGYSKARKTMRDIETGVATEKRRQIAAEGWIA